jgi:8-oxo-dGTP pyrophosphatase MutT (NUDIX family)
MRSLRKDFSARPLGHALVEPGTPPVKPRDAATLLVWRNGAAGVEVLMGRRSRKAAFVPDFFVFPGGRLDSEDRAVRTATPLDPALVESMGVRGQARTAEALAVAAVRETFEETGLLLADRGDVGPVANPVWTEWKARGLAPALQHLGYFGRAITSPSSPIRFNARFFIAHAGTLQGTIAGSGELSDLAFYSAEAVLRDKPILDVTDFMLRQLIGTAGTGSVAPVDAPVFSYRGGAAVVHYPLRNSADRRKRRGQPEGPELADAG